MITPIKKIGCARFDAHSAYTAPYATTTPKRIIKIGGIASVLGGKSPADARRRAEGYARERVRARVSFSSF